MGLIVNTNLILLIKHNVLKNPYEINDTLGDYQKPLTTNNNKYKTYCGT